MADESEKKPEFVVIKKEKKPETQSEKKVVVVKRKPAAPEKQKKVAVRVVAKKAPETSAKPEEKPVAEKTKETAVQQTALKAAAPVQEKPAERKVENNSERPQQQNKPQRQSFEINSARPNVRAGNLSGSGSRGGYGNRYNSGYGNNRGSGFTGAQAREGYQNRERSGGYNNNRGGNGFNGNGANRQGGFNGNRGGNGFNGNGANRQGGFNNNRQGGGFNRQGGGFGGSRPGFGGSRPGFGGGSSFVPPAPIPQGKTPAKKQFKGKKQDYSQRKDKEEFFDEEELYKKKKESTPANVVPPTIDIMETISVSDLARKMNLKAGEIIGKLMSMGMMVTINQSIDSDTATILAEEYNCKVHLISLYDETVIESDKGNAEGERSRPPIVTVMGHVDHGKTKTLDAIRNANVAAGEAGGITQKIGAYRVSTPKGDITFLDTPGHEAFTMMRARGAQITDIVILVVAADDGVMPQTLEAIHHAKDAKVPIIVAVNKMDKPDANPERVMTQLSEHGLTPEAWGGDTQYVNISALKREGIDELLDAVLIQAEMLELKAQYDCRAEGKVIESRIDQGRGVVASVIIERGTLRTGDPFVAGIYSGRVRAMFNDKGQKITEAGPCTPVEVLGIENMPNAGDPFQVTESEKDARAFAAKRQELKRFEDAKAVKKVTLDNLYSTIEASEVKEFKVIIKADLQGSAEALKASLEKLSTKEIRLSVIHSSAGAINESDVTLAAADSNAIIIGFNVRPTPKAKALAEQEKVEIRKYNIIYKCVEEIQQAMEGMLQPDTKEEVTGTIEVLNTFKVPKVGLIAGCMVRDGIVKRTSYVNVIRDGVVVCSAAKVSSLKRFKDDAKEVREGFECGLGIENWQDIQVGDTIEAFEYIEVKRKLGQTLAEEQAEAEKHQASDSGESQEN
ncbi:translation initiation factor IF-2 [Treponema sp.]|jgi:translation initiation factor IF-2|uniref:translation initiation factor IF-2 n=1 Tax=Treponema sp. TaxID=166 RepID=UPI00257D5E3B|nr:translation initiation factor IF-2 [Treponema sp.]MBE6353754.1 translation initiation factor IF-2 [Treponema sp.]